MFTGVTCPVRPRYYTTDTRVSVDRLGRCTARNVTVCYLCPAWCTPGRRNNRQKPGFRSGVSLLRPLRIGRYDPYAGTSSATGEW